MKSSAYASDEIKSTHPPSRWISSNEVGFHRRRRFHPPERVDLAEKDRFLSESVFFWQGQKGSFSPAGSVGASATQRSPPETRTPRHAPRASDSSLFYTQTKNKNGHLAVSVFQTGSAIQITAKPCISSILQELHIINLARGCMSSKRSFAYHQADSFLIHT